MARSSQGVYRDNDKGGNRSGRPRARSLGLALHSGPVNENVSTLNKAGSHSLEHLVERAHDGVQYRYFLPGQILEVFFFDSAANHRFDPFGKYEVAKGIGRCLRQHYGPLFEYKALLIEESDENFRRQIKSGRNIIAQ